MKSHYKKIGDYIQLVDERNTGLKVTLLLGLTISKQFIPSVANIIGTDMENYKIIRKNQFACSTMQVRRDRKMPVALLQDFDEAIISPAYPVFEVIDPQKLLPEYLMMWFSRAEFDREALFYAIGGVRGSLEWEDFCNMTLPIPSPDKQREIIAEYNTILNRINLNNQLIQKLEETAQAIYKQWFVDFEFPNENGEPYKSAGGEMVGSELGDIPKEWKLSSFTKTFRLTGGGTPSTEVESYWNGDIPFFTAKDVTNRYYSIDIERFITESGLENCSSRLYPQNTTFVVARGATVGSVALSGKEMAMNQTCYAISGKNGSSYFAHQSTIHLMKTLTNEANGATFEALVTKNFDEQIIVEPTDIVIKEYEKVMGKVYEAMLSYSKTNVSLIKFRDLLLSKLATVEN